MILNDKQIKLYVGISNSVSEKVQKGTTMNGMTDRKVMSSYGIDPQGYTFRLQAEDYIYVNPGMCEQLDSYESFTLPKNICAFMYGKSSFTRKGLFFCFAVVDAGYCGKIGFSVYNASSSPILLYPHEGIAQIVFHTIAPPEQDYKGIWQNYEGLGNK